MVIHPLSNYQIQQSKRINMGTVRIEGIPWAIEIEGDKPTKQEAERIKKIA